MEEGAVVLRRDRGD